MGRHLLQAFANHDPERFAQLLGSANDVSEAIEILEGIPGEAGGEVLSKLSPEAADRLLAALSDELLGKWLAACPSDVGRRLLVRVTPERSERLISRIRDAAKRRGLRRITTYPADSIGAHMQPRVLTIPELATAAEAELAFQEHEGGPDCPAVILGANGKVSGVLDLVAFVRNREQDARAAEFCIPVPPVHAESPISTVVDGAEWRHLASLPVVDFEDKLVGYVTRAELESAVRKLRPGNVFLDSSVELAARLLQFLAYTMVLIISRRDEP